MILKFSAWGIEIDKEYLIIRCLDKVLFFGVHWLRQVLLKIVYYLFKLQRYRRLLRLKALLWVEKFLGL